MFLRLRAAFHRKQELQTPTLQHFKSALRKTSRKRRSLRHAIERLESRQLLAADFGYAYDPADLESVDPVELSPASIADVGETYGEAVATEQIFSLASSAAVDASLADVTSSSLLDAENIIFVDDDAAGANDGSSWTDAFKNLQDALAAAELTPEPDEIWIAEGVYRPTTTTDRTVAFTLPNHVSLLGGFAGDPNNPDRRDVDALPSILSGDIGVPGDASDNAFHVVEVHRTTASLDGLTVTGGNANHFFFVNGTGGGIRVAGGTLYVANTDVTGNSARIAGGGLFSIGGAHVSIAGSNFADNSARFGGGIVADRSTVAVHDSHIAGNEAIFGGGLYNYIGRVAVQDSHIENNEAIFGGGLYNSIGRVTVQDSHVAGNEARIHGGGLYSAMGVVTVDSSHVTGNRAIREDGGGMYLGSGISDIFNTIVSGNAANSEGGGIFGTQGIQLTLTDSSLVSNSAEVGGGALIFRGDLVVDRSTVVDNHATIHGGGLYSFFSNSSVQESIVRDNTALREGGGLRVYGGTTSVRDSEVSGNSAGSFGGGIGILGSSTKAILANVDISENSAINGGGISNSRGRLSLAESTVADNHALFGGGIFSQLFAMVDVTGSAISNNVADENGGGILNFLGDVSIEDSVLRGNEALGLNPDDFSFAVGKGGAIENVGLSVGASLMVHNTVFHQNFAATEGGAIANNGPASNLVITESRLSGNRAGLDGGGVFNEGTLTAENVHFAHNVAGRNGGGIYNADGTVRIISSIFSGNRTLEKTGVGSAIYNSPLGQLFLDAQTVVSQNAVAVFEEA